MKTPETPLLTIGERLKWVRELRGLSQEELAAAAKVSQGTIGNVESGLRKQPRNLLSIARALQASHEWLLTGKGEWEPGSKAEQKGLVFEALSEAEQEFLDMLRNMGDDDIADLTIEAAKRSAKYRAMQEKIRAQLGIQSKADRIAHASKAIIERASVRADAHLKQRSLLDDDKSDGENP